MKIRQLNRALPFNRFADSPCKEMVPFRSLWPGMLLIVIFAAVLWRLALFTGRSVIHGDLIGFGLPLFDLGGRAYWGDASTLWSAGVYGGHPLFAEGQGAFASPLTILIGMIVTPLAGPIFAMNFFQFVSLLLTGAGMLGLCRQLRFSALACAFAALAVTFSPLWIFFLQGNPVLAGTFLWVPWCLWALELWLERPDFRSSTFLGTTCAAMLLAGYAPGLHAALLYMLVRAVVEPFDAQIRADWRGTWRKRMLTGLVAVLIFVGLSAIQWLPLLELVTQSHRNAGTGLMRIPDSLTALRSLFYGSQLPDAMKDVGSPLIMGLVLLAVFGVRSTRIAGHLIAALVLMQLSFRSPFFQFVYDHNLVPGLHFVRVMVQYSVPGMVGIVIVAGSSVDAIGEWFQQPTTTRRRMVLGGAIAIWAGFAAMLHSSDVSIAQLVIALIAFVVVTVLNMSRNARFVPMALFILLATECSLRLFPFQMIRTDNFQMPASVAAVQSTKNWSDFKVIDATISITYGMKNPHTSGMPTEMKTMLSSMSGLTSTMWGLHSMDGALALPMARYTMLTQPILDELHGNSTLSPGLRLIDTLGIRYISSYDLPKDGTALRPLWHTPDTPWTLENTAALPRFQIYTDHVTVDSPDAALAYMKAWTRRTLVIENPPGAHHQTEPADVAVSSPVSGTPVITPAITPIQFELIKATDTDYHLNLHATEPGWLFLADANYPGWVAYLDGKPVPLFSAQVLGKAVAIPQGQHDLVIRFESISFRWGFRITLMTLALLITALILDRRRNR